MKYETRHQKMLLSIMRIVVHNQRPEEDVHETRRMVPTNKTSMFLVKWTLFVNEEEEGRISLLKRIEGNPRLNYFISSNNENSPCLFVSYCFLPFLSRPHGQIAGFLAISSTSSSSVKSLCPLFIEGGRGRSSRGRGSESDLNSKQSGSRHF
jgi:hypothetical protein